MAINIVERLSKCNAPALARLDEFTMAHGRKVVIDPCQDPIGFARARWHAEPARDKLTQLFYVIDPFGRIPGSSGKVQRSAVVNCDGMGQWPIKSRFVTIERM